jgi:undecaprenyl-diphosphatase
MTSILETLVLGIIQGLTEWFPVSSSGHLTMAKEIAGWDPPLLFLVLLHVATLSVLITFFRKTIKDILWALVKRDFNSTEGKYGVLLIVGTTPTAIIGFIFRDIFTTFFSNLLVVGVALLTTGTLLYISKTGEGKNSIDYLDAFLIGVAQGISIIPGISRSGATISAGSMRGIDKQKVFEFSFILSIPAILGAAIVESSDLPLLVTNEGDLYALIVGVIASIIVGFVSLKILQRIVIAEKLHYFSPYCWLIGILIIVSQML